MQPEHHEIVEVGDAFISLGYTDYTPDEQAYISRFLNQYATELNEAEIQTVFKNRSSIIHAIKILNNFANQYQNDKDVIIEFNEEIHDLLINLNGRNEGISF